MEKAIDLDDSYDYPSFIRGCTYYYLKDMERARSDIVMASELNPHYEKNHGHNSWFAVVQKILG